MDDAQQRANRNLEPRVDLLPGPAVHPDLTALAALPAADKDGAARAVQITLLKRESFANSQARPPEQHDQRTEAMPLGADSGRGSRLGEGSE